MTLAGDYRYALSGRDVRGSNPPSTVADDGTMDPGISPTVQWKSQHTLVLLAPTSGTRSSLGWMKKLVGRDLALAISSGWLAGWLAEIHLG